METLTRDEQEVLRHLRALKSHGHGQVTARVQDSRVTMIEENRTHRI